MRSLLVSLFVLPILLGLIAGAGNLSNLDPEIHLALTDQDNSAASREFAIRLENHNWTIIRTDEADARRLLLRQHVDGVIIIESGYSDSLPELRESKIAYIQAEGSLITTIVREAVAAAVLPAHAKASMLRRIEQRLMDLQQPIPPELAVEFSESMAEYAVNEAALQVDYIGRIQAVPALTAVVSDYSMEVFLLSIYAILGGITLAGKDLRHRLASTYYGLLLDYSATMLSLYGLGIVQIVAYAAAMSAIMGTALLLQDIFSLSVYLLLLLGLAQALQLLEKSIRIFFSLLLLHLLAIAGGCFFHLSESLMRYLGQYTPHGWVLGRIGGYPVLPLYWPVFLSLLLLILGYLLHVRRAAISG